MDEATVRLPFVSFSSAKCCRRSKLTKFLAGRHHAMIQQWLSVHDYKLSSGKNKNDCKHLMYQDPGLSYNRDEEGDP